MRHDGVVLRGTIDCLAVQDDAVTVIEFKSGRPLAEHQEQVSVYKRAAEHIFPGTRVRTLLVYPDAAASR